MEFIANGDHYSWLNKETTLVIGKVMCENLRVRKFFLEKFPNCFLSEGIKFFNNFYDEESEEELSSLFEDIPNDKKKKIRRTLHLNFLKTVDLPQLNLFGEKTSNLTKQQTMSFLGKGRTLANTCAQIINITDKLIEIGFDLSSLIKQGALLKEKESIYICKEHSFSFKGCNCSSCKEYALYSFDKDTQDFWMGSPHNFLEAMCGYVLREKYKSYFEFSQLCKDKKGEVHELDFISRDKKITILCADNPNEKQERKQIEFCIKNGSKVIIISEHPYEGEEDVIKIPYCKNITDFKEKLINEIDKIKQ
jgi:hypothetical protein